MYGIVRRQVCGKNTRLSFSHFDSLFLKLVKGKVKRKNKEQDLWFSDKIVENFLAERVSL